MQAMTILWPHTHRIRNAQQETSKLRHQLHQIEDECQDIFRDLQLSQTSKFGLIRELTKLEEQLSLKLMSGYGIEVSSSSSNDESAEGHVSSSHVCLHVHACVQYRYNMVSSVQHTRCHGTVFPFIHSSNQQNTTTLSF